MTIFTEKYFADCSLVLCQGQNREIHNKFLPRKFAHYIVLSGEGEGWQGKIEREDKEDERITLSV